ncbi:MAG TPA: L-rhamnose/proton symporter RhaT [Verrucomicrobiae bacterium]|nr:L-rhamnose/proton symporter RhaT [Verrucomicrobiae bacterium]
MQQNPLLGVVFHWLGGLASGSFYVPFKGVRKWSWETFWLAGGMFSWFICPWVGAFLLSKDLLAVLHETPSRTFWLTYLMGALWGLGGLTFGLTMRYLGMSLGMAIALGYCAAFGTLVPPIVKGEFADKLLNHSGASVGGPIVLLGVFVCLLGILIGGIAGVRKEKEMAGQSSTIAEFNLWKGLGIATFSGVMSSCFSFGFQFGDPITKITAAHGTGPLWVGLPVIVVILLGGLTTNFIWCVLLHIKNGSAHQYFSPTVKPVAGQTAGGDGHGGKASVQSFELGSAVPLGSNWMFCILAGLFWYLQFFFYQMGESQMGNYKFSSWTLHMASIIIFSTLWGIFFKEWRGARPFTKNLVVLMLALLVGSTCIIGWGNKKSEDAENALKAKVEAAVPAVRATAADAVQQVPK